MGRRGPLPTVSMVPAVRPQAAVKAPTAPKGLGTAGRSCWRSTWAAAGAWLAPASDGAVVERYCLLRDEAEELRELIDRDGRVCRGSMGQPATAPAVDQLRAVETSLLKHEAVLGLGPANRARLGLAVLQLEKEADLVAQMRADRLRIAQKGGATR